MAKKTDSEKTFLYALLAGFGILVALYGSHNLAVACSPYYAGGFDNVLITVGSGLFGIFGFLGLRGGVK